MHQSFTLLTALGFASLAPLQASAFAGETYVLDAAGSADADCTELYQKLWHALVEGQTDGRLHLRWEIDCGGSHALPAVARSATADGKTDFAVQVVVEADASAAQPLAAYLAERQDLDFWGIPMAFRQATQLEQTLTVEAGILDDTNGWDFKVLDSSVYQAAYPSDTDYLAFYGTLTDAFWFAGVDGFTDFIGHLFGAEFAAAYRAQILPRATAVRTTTKLRWDMRDGSQIESRMIYDILHDCRVRENGHCA